MATLRTCPFCTRLDQPETMEHVWPDWLGREVLKGRSAPRLAQSVGSREFKPKQVSSLTLAVPLCLACNGGWLKALEDNVVPFLRAMACDPGSVTMVDHSRRVMLTQWCLARAMVYDLRDAAVFFTDAERAEFASFGALPANTHIWMGRYDGTRPIHAQPEKPRPKGAEGLPTAYSLTWTAGHFLMQLAAWRVGSGSSPRVAPHDSSRLWQLAPALPSTEIWRWPAQEISDDELVALESRFWRLPA